MRVRKLSENFSLKIGVGALFVENNTVRAMKTWKECIYECSPIDTYLRS